MVTDLKSYFPWEKCGIYQYSDTPNSGYLKAVGPFIGNILSMNNHILWLDFHNKFESYGLDRYLTNETILKNLLVSKPVLLSDAVKFIDDLEGNYLLAPNKPYLIVCDFLFSYALDKKLNPPLIASLTFIIAMLEKYTQEYDIRVLFINELRQIPTTGKIKPFLDFIIRRYCNLSNISE